MPKDLISQHGIDLAGTTAQRPVNAPHGARYYDDDVKAVIARDNNVSPARWVEDAALHQKDVTITTAQVLALNATPITLVAAPGANKALIFEGAVVFYDFNTAAYGGIAVGEDLSIKYTGSTGLEVSQVEATGFIDQASDQVRYAQPHRAASGNNSITPVANAPLVLHMLVGEVITGDGPLKLRVYYRVVPTTL